MIVMKGVFWLTCAGVVLAAGQVASPGDQRTGAWPLTRDVLILFAMGVLGLVAFIFVARFLNVIADLLVDFVHWLP